MHCSSCEPLLDRYLEGTLPARRMADVRAHIASCEHCRGLLDEVKVIDALLFTTKVPDLPPNFTFAVMAEVHSMPAIRASSHRVWSFLALYSAAAWVAAILALALTGTSVQWVLGQITSAATGIAAGLGGLFAGAPHATPQLATFGFGVLALDAVLAALVGVLYFGVRPRLASAIAFTRRSGHD